MHGADATELSKLAITRPSRFHAPKSHKDAPKVEPSSEDRIDVNLGAWRETSSKHWFRSAKSTTDR